jgi:DNA repair exonuclease SbcCD ATPase subunit
MANYYNGQIINSARFGIKDLKCWSYVFLGDIHKPQFLTPYIAYSGSFVQKNKGEGLDHGYILWDLQKQCGQHVFIPVKEPFLKIHAVDNQVSLPEISAEQTVQYITLVHTGCDSDFIGDLSKKIPEKYGCQINKIINKSTYDAPIDNIRLEPKKSQEINQERLIKEILNHLPEKDINKIIDHHNSLRANRTQIKHTTYRLNYLCWSNILSYGENNYIDFRNFRQNIVLLNGRNKSGKSSIIDILIRILFNECERGYKDDMVNKLEKSGHIKLSISISNDEYILEQYLVPDKKIKLHKLYKNGEDITKDTMNDTYKYLKHDIGIGDYKDFVNMTTAMQNRKFLIDMDCREMITLLSKLLDVDMLSEFEKDTKTAINSLKRTSKKIIKELGTLQVTDEDLEQKEKKYLNTENEYKNTRQRIAEINTQIKSLYAGYTPIKIPDNLDDLEYIDVQSLRIEAELIRKSLSFAIQKGPLITAEKYKQNKDELAHLDSKVIERPTIARKELEKYLVDDHSWELDNTRMDELRKQIDILTSKAKPLVDLKLNRSVAELQKFAKFTGEIQPCDIKETIKLNNVVDAPIHVNPNCFACSLNAKDMSITGTPRKTHDYIIEQNKLLKHNKYVRLAKQAKHDLEALANKEICVQLDKCRAKYDQLTKAHMNKMQDILKRKDKITQYKEMLSQWDKWDNYNKYCALSNENAIYDRHRLEKLTAKIADAQVLGGYNLEQLKKIKDTNTRIKNKIDELNKELVRMEEINAEQHKQFKIHSEDIAVAKSALKMKKELNAEYQVHMEELNFLENYHKCIEFKSGIPSLILRNMCHILNERCNSILTKITDFEVEFHHNDEFKVYTVESGVKVPATMGSGFQKFILDMIMRITLTHIAVISCPDVIFIDEGFGCLDRDNFIQVAQILVKLKTNFDAIIIITHIDELKTYADHYLNIKKDAKYSRIQWGEPDTSHSIVSNLSVNNKSLTSYKTGIKSFNIEQMKMYMIDFSSGKPYCKACSKAFSTKSIEKHIMAKTHETKHKKYMMQFKE